MGALLGAMGSMGEMGGMASELAGGLEQAAGALEQAAGGIEQAVSGMMGGGQGGQDQTSGASGPAGQSGPQGLEQELSQALQQLSQELQQLTGGQEGGQSAGGSGQPAGGSGQPAGGSGQPAGGSGQPAGISGNAAAELPDLMNLEVDAAGSSGKGVSSHVGGDLDRLRGEVQQGMQDGTISMQTGSKALEDIGSGNVQAVEQDLSGTSGSTAGVDSMKAGAEAAGIPEQWNPNGGAY